MKTFIINSLKDAISLNNKLDSVAMIQNKEWTVYTDEGDITEKFIFLKKGTLINSINGMTKNYQWQYITVNSSIIIDTGTSSLLFRIVFCDKNLLILNLDGTREYCFLIDKIESGKNLLSYENIQWYLIRNCNIDILSDNQKLEYQEEKKKEEEKKKVEYEKQQEEEDKRQGRILVISYLLLIFFLLLAFCARTD